MFLIDVASFLTLDVSALISVVAGTRNLVFDCSTGNGYCKISDMVSKVIHIVRAPTSRYCGYIAPGLCCHWHF